MAFEHPYLSCGPASASVGQYAIQLAHLSGYKVVTTASPHNFDLVKSLGADHVFDYNEPTAVEQIKKATGDSVRSVFNTIITKESIEFCAQVIAPDGGKLILVRPQHPHVSLREGVQYIRMCY